jgi:SAM-dependent methyltransferase
MITGLSNTGKTYFAQQLIKKTSKEHIIDVLDVFCWDLTSEEKLKSRIKECFEKTGVSILIIETQPPFIFDLTDPSYAVLNIHLKLNYADWKANVKKAHKYKEENLIIGNVNYGEFIERCLKNKNYYEGATVAYELVCSRKVETKTFDSIVTALDFVLDFLSLNIESTLQARKKEFLEYKTSHNIAPDYQVFQYQSFDYGNGIKNEGMSDPPYKWLQVLLMNNFNLWGKTLLDIGCNIGEISYLAANNGIVTGIELNKEFYDAAVFLQKFRKRPITFINADFMTYNFETQYDFVLALAVEYVFYQRYSIEEVFAKIKSVTKEVFIGELTYNEDNREQVYQALKNNFKKVELIGDSFRTNIKDLSPWFCRMDRVPTRQVWYCYV